LKEVTDTTVIGQHEMVEETAELMWKGLKQGVKMYVIINNRFGGNAPIIAQYVAKRFLSLQLNLG
jgi:hypothetical protein